MRTHHLRTRFVLAGCLFVATTVGTGAWSALTFARLSAAVNNALGATQEKIDLAAELVGSLEREDDALLLALGGDVDKAQRELAMERARGGSCYERLAADLENGPAREQAVLRELRAEMDLYRKAGTDWLATSRAPGALERYHKHVNPALRQAVASCGKIREENVASLRQAGVGARDEARRATWVVVAAAASAVVLATGVAVWLARSVVVQVRALAEAMEAVRLGDFDRRVSVTSSDELGQLAAGLNRMTETLGEFHRSSLGELLAAKMTLEGTLNALPDAVLVIAPDGGLAMVNPPAQTILAALGAASARSLQELPLRPEHRELVDEALGGLPAVPKRTAFETALLVTLNGRPHRFLLSAVPIPEIAPRRTGAVIVLEDITDLARLDELRGEVIGLASHELKSPLSAMQLNLELLREEAIGLPTAQLELLDAALGGCKNLTATINEFLDTTQVETGQLRLDLAPVDLATVLDRALRGLRGRFDKAQVQVQVFPGSERALVQGDAVRLGHVVTNLLTNALKYSPPGGIVSVRISLAPAGAQLEVNDQGPGVPADLRERVFEKFFRVEHQFSGPKPVRGTGLGLYLSREIVKAHGGSIRCEAGAEGVGTRMVVVLPAGYRPPAE